MAEEGGEWVCGCVVLDMMPNKKTSDAQRKGARGKDVCGEERGQQ